MAITIIRISSISPAIICWNIPNRETYSSIRQISTISSHAPVPSSRIPRSEISTKVGNVGKGIPPKKEDHYKNRNADRLFHKEAIREANAPNHDIASWLGDYALFKKTKAACI